MCFNIQSLRCHLDELKNVLETYKNKPTVTALTEIWLNTNDDIDEEYNLKHYQLIESKPRITDTRGGVVFCIREGLQYRIIEYHCDLECLIWSAKLGNKTLLRRIHTSRHQNEIFVKQMENYYNITKFE